MNNINDISLRTHHSDSLHSEYDCAEEYRDFHRSSQYFPIFRNWRQVYKNVIESDGKADADEQICQNRKWNQVLEFTNETYECQRHKEHEHINANVQFLVMVIHYLKFEKENFCRQSQRKTIIFMHIV